MAKKCVLITGNTGEEILNRAAQQDPSLDGCYHPAAQSFVNYSPGNEVSTFNTNINSEYHAPGALNG